MNINIIINVQKIIPFSSRKPKLLKLKTKYCIRLLHFIYIIVYKYSVILFISNITVTNTNYYLYHFYIKFKKKYFSYLKFQV